MFNWVLIRQVFIIYYASIFDFTLPKLVTFLYYRNVSLHYNKPVHFQVPFTTIPLKLAVTDVRAVASGLRHSAILTRDGHVLVCGNGKNGQLGLTDNNGVPIVGVEHPQLGT
jgi:hypothetical protein